MKRKELEQQVEVLVNQLLAGGETELIDVEYVKEGHDYFLRVFLDKPGGITINDCETLSRRLDAKLDEHDWIQDHYYLEVSSPGLDRPLKKPADFKRNIGKRVEVKLYQLVDGEKLFEGILIDKNNDTIIIETDNKQQLVFKDSQVALVRLAIIF
jgi:ribosome maturation factor RimP